MIELLLGCCFIMLFLINKKVNELRHRTQLVVAIISSSLARTDFVTEEEWQELQKFNTYDIDKQEE